MKEKSTAKLNWLLIGIVYLTMLMFGLVENIKGVSFPLIKAEFGVPYSEQGGLVSLSWFGYVAFCLVAGLFQHRFGSKRTLLAGYLLVAAGSAATLAAPTFWAVSLTLVLVNTGFGFFEVGTNALGTQLFTRRAALMMSLMHFFYGFGAIAGPKAAGIMTQAMGLGWRQVYLAVIIPMALLFLAILFIRFRPTVEPEAKATAHKGLSFLGAFRQPMVWAFALALGFMEVVEFGAANWGGLYLQDVYGLDPRTVGASFVSLFYILFTASRLLSGIAIEKIGYMRSIYWAAGCILAVYLVGFLLGRGGIWVLPVTGLFIAIMWPTMMAIAMQVFGDDAPNATSAVITISGAINGVVQMVIGLTNAYVGEAWGYRSCFLYAVIMVIMVALLVRRMKLKPYTMQGSEA